MIDLAIVVAFVLYAVAAGFRARRRASKGLHEYFLAGRSLAGWKAGISMAATQYAADTPLLFVGLVATGGIHLLWRLWIYGIAFLLMAFLFAPLWRRSGVLTDAELTEIRYSGRAVLPLRVLKAIYYGTVINCVVMAMVLVAALRIAEVFLPWHAWLPSAAYDVVLRFVEATGLSLASAASLPEPIATANGLISILVMLAFIGLYSTTGGLRSVVATDQMQFGVAMLGTTVYAAIVLTRSESWGALPNRLVEIYGVAQAQEMLSWAPSASDALLPFLVVVGLQWLFQMNSDATGYLAQRSMACRTDGDARIAGVVFAWMQIVVRSVVWLIIALGLLVLYPHDPSAATSQGFVASREILFVTGIEELLPVGIRGLMLTGLLAALASTLDTHLNWGASYWSNDVYRRLVCGAWLRREATSRELVAVARLSNVLVVVVALAIMVNLDSIQKAWFISLLFGAGIGSVLVLRWLWERTNVYSELAAVLVSLLVAPLFLVLTDQEWIRLSGMALVSTVAVVVTTMLTPATESQVLRSFYERVRPVGFWGRTAVVSGDDAGAPRRRLARALTAACWSCLSLFLALVGAGRLLIEGVASVLPVLSLLAGLGLVPVWWRKLRRLD